MNNVQGLTLGTTEKVTGEYEGNPERTMVVQAKYNRSPQEFRKMVTRLADAMNQEAIAVKLGDRGTLVWGAKQEPKYDFDPQFFIEPTQSQDEFSLSERKGGTTAEGLTSSWY